VAGAGPVAWAGEQTTTVWITYGACTGGGIADGTSAVQVTAPVMDAVLRDVLRRSYGWIGELPA